MIIKSVLIDREILTGSLDNAWSALARQYVDSPDEATRQAVNLIAGMVKEINSYLDELEESERKEKESISIQEWIDWLKEG